MLQKLNFDFSNDVSKNIVTAHFNNNTNESYLLSNPEHKIWQGIDTKPVCVFLCKEIENGIYQTDFNFSYDIANYTSFEVFDKYDRLGKDGIPVPFNQEKNNNDYFETTLATYGVADNIEQIKNKYKELIDSKNPIVISISEIRKDEQPEYDGWRWHKWGEYIGSKEITSEYIYNEPEIDSVYVFTVYAVKPQIKHSIHKKLKM
jgi:hypothetical protein